MTFGIQETMRIRKTLVAAIMLLLLCACQSESYQEVAQPQRNTIRVKASLPTSSKDTRAQVKYGTGQEQEGEIFMWNKKDWITLFNITRLSECPFGVALEEIEISPDGKSAEFESAESVDSTFVVKKGDKLLAVYGEINRVRYKDDAGNLFYDERNIITLVLGTEANKPQIIVENPDDSTLNYMKDNLKMYDIVTAVEDDKVPYLQFKHLSALMRVTLRNATGHDLYLTKLEFMYPGTKSFLNTTLYFSVESDETGGSYLQAYDDDKLYNGSNPYTDNIGATINTKDYTTDAGDVIRNGESYELYLSTVPRIGNDRTGKEFTIHIIEKHDTDNPYVITFNDFDTVIEAGRRYWFDLTATEDRKLVLTSEWEKLQNKQEEDTENNTEETDE